MAHVMDGVCGEPLTGNLARAQFGAVLHMRWRMLVNGLRTKQGKFELGARIFATGFLTTVWLSAGAGCGFVAYDIAASRSLMFLPFLLWPLLLIWQVVPIMLSTAQENVEFSFLLRFPVSFRSFVRLYLSFGIFDPSSLLGGICLLGIWIGAVVAWPAVTIWLALALALFGFFNFLLTRTIFAWIERWLAQRKTREILGIVFLFVFLGFQLLNPALRSQSGHSFHRAVFLQDLKVAQSMQSIFPPGLAAKSVEMAAKGDFLIATALLGGLALYGAGIGGLLAIRLRAEYRGENIGEAPPAVREQGAIPRVGLRRELTGPTVDTRRWLDGPVGAVLAKEIRYLSRSGVMLFGLFVPLVFVFAMGGPVHTDQSVVLHYAFPFAVAYGFLPLTRQFCNSLGTEGAGIQLYFLSPTPFRSVMLAKNLLQTMLFCVELLLVATIAIFRFGIPGRGLAIATFCWVLFALPANLAAGNMLSITMAYRMTLTRVSREQGSVGNGLLSLLIQVLIFAVGVAVYLPLNVTHHSVLAAPVLLAMAAVSVLFWLRILSNVDRLAANRRESLMTVLVRPA